MSPNEIKSLISELEALKKLMILSLFEKGFTQKQIGLTLGVSQGTVSKMFPSGAIKKRAKELDVESD